MFGGGESGLVLEIDLFNDGFFGVLWLILLIYVVHVHSLDGATQRFVYIPARP